MPTVAEATARTKERIAARKASKNSSGSYSSSELRRIAQEVGGKINTGKGGERVEYQIRGVKDGRRYKSTGYIYGPQDYEQFKSYKGPVASDVFPSDYGKDNYTGPIKSDLLAPTPEIKFPTPPAPTNIGTDAMTKAAATATAAQNTTAQAAATKPSDTLKDLIQSLEKAPNQEAIYAKAEREAQLSQKQTRVNSLTEQIGAITAKAQADKLSLEGMGRGVPEVIIGGQQAAIDRQAAIQTLPLAAQLSAAQDDLESARDHVDTLFKLRLADAQAKVDYKNKIAELVYNYATDQEKIALEDRRTRDEREWEIKKMTFENANDLAKEAFANGQYSLGTQLMNLDHNLSVAEYTRQMTTLGSGITPKSSSSTRAPATLEERRASSLATLSSYISPEVMTPSGLTVLNPEGYINPAAWKEMIANVNELGLTRADFIENFGHLIYIDKKGVPSDAYGLTPKEKRDLGYE